jgi:hypothetical protein
MNAFRFDIENNNEADHSNDLKIFETYSLYVDGKYSAINLINSN